MSAPRAVPAGWKIALLSLLYFAQGLPYGFQANALPAYLRASGISLTGISLAGALSLPWLLKALWAPLVEKYGSAQLGRRRSWILPMLGVMALGCLLAAQLPPQTHLAALLWTILLLNFATATQDIAVDGLAVDLLGERELGAGNAAQVVGYKVGGLTGGGLLGAVGGAIGWAGMFQVMAALCLLVLLVVFAVREPQVAAHAGKAGPSVRETLARLLQVARQPGTLWVLLFVATYKVGETAADRMFQPFLVDHRIEAWRTTLWLGTYGMVASLLGSVGGGLLAGRMRLLHAVTWTAAARVLPLAAQLALVAGLLPVTAQTVIPITCAEHFFGGALTTAMFAFMMSRVDRRIGATHFTLLASVEVLGKSLPGLLSGVVADRFGYPPVYAFAVAASVLFLVLVGPVRAVLRAQPEPLAG